MFKAIFFSKRIYHCLVGGMCLCLVMCIATQLIHLLPIGDRIIPADTKALIAPYTGEIEITLDPKYQPHKNMIVLVNGMQAGNLSGGALRLSVMNNSIIEIDGRRVSYPFDVSLSPIDEYIECNGDYAQVDGNVSRLSRILFNN
ncbi:MAG: hypothetical protein PHE51_03990 [Eubacteriales bacterium]|nr:hypothetical protein [Eubacteriales bacterium]